VGETEKNIRALFVCAGELLERKAARYKSAVIFMDEFDGLAADRESGPNAGDSVNEFLQNMDGLKSNARVSVLAATNYPWSIDDAILRRFDTRIFVDLPDRLARISIILSELAKAYALPGSDPDQARVYIVSEDEETGEVTWSAAERNLWRNLGDYGAKKTVIKTVQKGGIIRSAVTAEVLEADLSIKDVEWLADVTGPKPTSKDLMGRASEAEYSDLSVHPYGYSASDLNKLVKKAIALASLRVVRERAARNLHVVKFKDFRTGAEKPYFVYDPNGTASAITSLAEVELNQKDMVESVVAFNITRRDLETAQRMFSSTIDSEKYKQMKEWVKKNAPSSP
jgi:SpoVK/Ycf46/Vps4 family AAA+-type ATPase